MQSSQDHAPLVAIGDAVVVSDNGGFPCSVVIELTDGPLKGKSVYYGHAQPIVVKTGQKVRAGQVIAHTHGIGCGADPYVGWTEIGWANARTAYPVAVDCDGQCAPYASAPGATREGNSFHQLLLALQKNRKQSAPTPKGSGSPAQ